MRAKKPKKAIRISREPGDHPGLAILADGEMVVVTQLPNAIDGLRVKIAE